MCGMLLLTDISPSCSAELPGDRAVPYTHAPYLRSNDCRSATSC